MNKKLTLDLDIYQLLSYVYLLFLLGINNNGNSILSVIIIFITLLFVFKPIYLLPSLFVTAIIKKYFLLFNSIPVFTIICLVYLLGTFFVFLKEKRKFNIKYILFMILFFSFNFLSAARSITGNIRPAFSMNLNIFLLFFISYSIDKKNINIVKMFFNNFVIVIGYIFFIFISDNLLFINDRMVLDELLNPNRVAMLLAQINSFFFGYFIISKKPKRFIITLIILITTYFIFMTGSRSSMLAFVFSTFLISIIIIHKKRNFVINLFIIVFITSILYAYFSFFHTGIINKYSINNIIKSGGSGRISIWVAIINNILPRFYLFGVGLGGENVIKAVTPFLKIPRGTHNFLLTVITETGIVGFFLYFIFYSYFIKIIFTKYFKVKYIIIPFTMFLTAVITGAGENIFSEVFLWFSIGFSFLIINNYFNSNKACSSAKYK